MKDDILATLRIQHDLRLFKVDGIVLETTDGNGFGCVEAMPIGHIAGNQTVDFKRDDPGFVMFRAEDADNRLQRPYPAKTFRTLSLDLVIGSSLRHGSSTPAHGFRPGKIADDIGHYLGNDLFCRTSGAQDHRDIVLTLLRVADR